MLKQEDRPSALETFGALTTASKKHIYVVKTLLEYGTPLDMPNQHGTNPLMGAIRSGNVEIVHLLIDTEADPNSFSYIDDGRTTPLTEAVRCGNNVIVAKSSYSKPVLM